MDATGRHSGDESGAQRMEKIITGWQVDAEKRGVLYWTQLLFLIEVECTSCKLCQLNKGNLTQATLFYCALICSIY